jgi:hypothetical protein
MWNSALQAVLSHQYPQMPSDKFDRFDENIRLTATQIDDANCKASNVQRALSRLYYEGATWGFDPGSFITGSYGKNTAIRPPSDIDLIFPLPWERFQHYTGFAIQSRILQDVRNGLLETFPQTNIKADGPVVMVPFQTFAVEVVPCFVSSKNNNKFVVCNTKNGGIWKEEDPRTQLLNVVSADAVFAGNATKLIRMLKSWKQACSVPIKSFHLELLAIDFSRTWTHVSETTDPLYHAWMIRDFFSFLLPRANGIVFVPGTLERLSIGSAWRVSAWRACINARQACKMEENRVAMINSTWGTSYLSSPISTTADQLATTEWRKIFGGSFTG